MAFLRLENVMIVHMVHLLIPFILAHEKYRNGVFRHIFLIFPKSAIYLGLGHLFVSLNASLESSFSGLL